MPSSRFPDQPEVAGDFCARLDAQSLVMARVVLGDGERHGAADATLDFLGNRGRIHSLRLHPHAETDKKLPIERLRAAVSDEHQPGCLALEEERGGNWTGNGVPVIKEIRPTL